MYTSLERFRLKKADQGFNISVVHGSVDTSRLWEDQRPEGSLIPKTMQQEIQQECLEFIKFNVCHLLLNATYKLNVIVVLSKA